MELIERAKKVAKSAYAPYSGFRVGAVLVCANGMVYEGSNVENSSYSLTVCAERTAFLKAVTEGEREFLKIALVGGYDEDYNKPCNPCGACLQVMSEFCGGDFVIETSDGEYKLEDFLPKKFDIAIPLDVHGK